MMAKKSKGSKRVICKFSPKGMKLPGTVEPKIEKKVKKLKKK